MQIECMAMRIAMRGRERGTGTARRFFNMRRRRDELAIPHSSVGRYSHTNSGEPGDTACPNLAPRRIEANNRTR